MAKLREGSVVRELTDARKAEKDFIVDLKYRCMTIGADERNIAAFYAKKLDLCETTGRKYINNPGAIPTEVLQRTVKALSPDIGKVLKFLGYSDKEIKRFAKELTAQ